jgi:hypothetical protein
MDKRTVATLWILGTALLGVAAVLIVADVVALAAHLDALPPASRQGLAPDDFSRSTLTLIVIGAGIAAVGLILQLAAWVGALANTYRLTERRWFNAMLWSGVIGILSLPLFGLGALIGGGAMLAYLVGGPAGAATAARPAIWAKVRIIRWSSWGLAPLAAGGLLSLVIAGQTNPGGLLHGHTWTALVLLITCAAVIVSGVLVEATAWWAAIFNARHLADRTWFTVLVWGGIVALLTMPLLGLGALIAAGVGLVYRIAAPDATAVIKATATSKPATA